MTAKEFLNLEINELKENGIEVYQAIYISELLINFANLKCKEQRDKDRYWTFYENEKAEKIIFIITAQNNEQAYQLAYDKYGPQVEDYFYSEFKPEF